MLTLLLRRAYAARRRSSVPMRCQSSFGAPRSEAATPSGATKEARLGWRKRLPASTVVIILGGALLSACQPIPQSYYDWLAAGGGYYDGYAPLFYGHFEWNRGRRGGVFRSSAPAVVLGTRLRDDQGRGRG